MRKGQRPPKRAGRRPWRWRRSGRQRNWAWANTEAGPLKRLKVAKGKEKVWETEPESEEEVVAGPSAMEKILADILEEQRLHNGKVLGEITQIHGALFQMGKLLKGTVLNTNDITDHLLSKEDEEPA